MMRQTATEWQMRATGWIKTATVTATGTAEKTAGAEAVGKAAGGQNDQPGHYWEARQRQTVGRHRVMMRQTATEWQAKAAERMATKAAAAAMNEAAGKAAKTNEAAGQAAGTSQR
jgi:hypothetical protein